jgi:hypothetical protein
MENATKVSAEAAEKEVKKWLDFKKVDATKQAENADSIKQLVDSIVNGWLVLDESYNLIMTLKFPILDEEGKEALTELKFKPRITVSEIQTRVSASKKSDLISLVIAYVSALTSQNSALIAKLESEDYKTASAIAYFFI